MYGHTWTHAHTHTHTRTHTYTGDAEVVSIDALIKEPNGVIIGVTLIKVSHLVNHTGTYTIEPAMAELHEIHSPQRTIAVSPKPLQINNYRGMLAVYGYS